MRIELTESQREILENLLEREIADLGPEIRHTDARAYRDDLRAQKQVLRELLEQLRPAPTA